MRQLHEQHVKLEGLGENYERIAALAGHKVRIVMHYDFYAFQSYARAQVWADKWEFVYAIEGERMGTATFRQLTPDECFDECDAVLVKVLT